ncbi:hypothetical protein MKZ38_006636 [Zalerion maritima]|uniref:DUF300-domain-containing protein n=1 Tax=Zalerion maritima TaxID=339359 RepID=A0AAD5RJD0_9PEZI|nr:hypothetical protein MKZ38_006636 [Zalerion maritima]
MTGGTGAKFAQATTVVAGIASLIATFLSAVSIWFQMYDTYFVFSSLTRYADSQAGRTTENLFYSDTVPIYSISSWISMISLTAAVWFDPIRDIYEAFTLYTFFQLLVNYMGGERALIMMMHGREPVNHLWPMNYALPRVDISDPHTFLAVKRGILQYAFLKPMLALATVIMKATGTYQEGYIGLKSGYFWSGIIYNLSVTLSLYSLGLFWVCMHDDLKPFRPVPKFLCIKLIIFASYWQGFFLSILVWLGAIPDSVEGYTPDNLAAAIQDALICIEMPAFAVAHWYAFSWTDYADHKVTQSRMPIYYALRDAFGIVDLIQDSKETFQGDLYKYRAFDSGDKVMAHEASKQRLARLKDGMRYERGGKGKYWIPRPGESSATTPLLGSNGGSGRSEGYSDVPNEPYLDPEEDAMYEDARTLEFGDWNVSCPGIADLFSPKVNNSKYPVITVETQREHLLAPSTPSYQRRGPSTLAVSREAVNEAIAESRGTSPVQSPSDSSAKKGKKKQKSALRQKADTTDDMSQSQPPPASQSRVHFTPPPQVQVSEPTSRETNGWGSDRDNDTASPDYVVGDDSDEFGNVWGR